MDYKKEMDIKIYKYTKLENDDILLEIVKINLKKSIKNIKKDHYKNYFIYAYNKDFYKGKKGSKQSSKHIKAKIYKP
jgi:hypothetical protein